MSWMTSCCGGSVVDEERMKDLKKNANESIVEHKWDLDELLAKYSTNIETVSDLPCARAVSQTRPDGWRQGPPPPPPPARVRNGPAEERDEHSLTIAASPRRLYAPALCALLL